MSCGISICDLCLTATHDGHPVRNLSRHLEEKCQLKEKQDFPCGLSAYSVRAREYIEQIDFELQYARERLAELEKARDLVVEKKEIVDDLTLNLVELKTEGVEKFINLNPELPSISVNFEASVSSSLCAERISKMCQPQIVSLDLLVKSGEPIATQQHGKLTVFGNLVSIRNDQK